MIQGVFRNITIKTRFECCLRPSRGSDSNFQKCQNWEFPKNLGIWATSQVPKYLEKFPKTQAFEKFLGII